MNKPQRCIHEIYSFFFFVLIYVNIRIIFEGMDLGICSDNTNSKNLDVMRRDGIVNPLHARWRHGGDFSWSVRMEHRVFMQSRPGLTNTWHVLIDVWTIRYLDRKHHSLSRFNQRCHNPPVQSTDDGRHSIIHSGFCPRENGMVKKVLEIGTSIHGLLSDSLFIEASIGIMNTIERRNLLLFLFSRKKKRNFRHMNQMGTHTHTHI